MNEQFGKKHKLCSQKRMAELFTHGRQIKSFPLVLHFHSGNTSSTPAWQIGVSAPKRNFKKASDRNRMKRLMREAIRKNKLPLESSVAKINRELSLFLVYTAKEIVTYSLLEKKINDVFNKLANELQNN